MDVTEEGIVAEGIPAPVSQGMREIAFGPDQRTIRIRSKEKTDIAHVGEQLWRGAIRVGEYLTKQWC